MHTRTLLRVFLDTCRAVQLLHTCLVKFKLSGTVASYNIPGTSVRTGALPDWAAFQSSG